MKCNDASVLLNVFSDGALNARDSALVLGHLKDCKVCHSEWRELEELQKRFDSARAISLPTSRLMDRISYNLKKEEKLERQQTLQKYARPAQWFAIASCLTVIGALTYSDMQTTSGTTSATSTTSNQTQAEALIDALYTGQGTEPLSNRQQLARQIGYDLKFMHLPTWNMYQSAIYKSEKSRAIARFDFIGRDNSGLLTCYQAPQGTIKALGQRRLVGAKPIIMGSHGPYQYALLSQNGRDYLFITRLPSTTLEQIIRSSSSS
jgi:hypothetical protein